ncbi:MAG: AzlD domain-containing protein [Truepera sp.]|nr:AzlD domain-containing protein [Truepera sp.]
MIWLAILGMGLITFGLRLSFLALSGRLAAPDWLTRALRFVPVAVLTALVVPAIIYREGVLSLSLSNERLIAGLLAAIVAWRTRSVLATLAVGMGGVWLLQALAR